MHPLFPPKSIAWCFFNISIQFCYQFSSCHPGAAGATTVEKKASAGFHSLFFHKLMFSTFNLKDVFYGNSRTTGDIMQEKQHTNLFGLESQPKYIPFSLAEPQISSDEKKVTLGPESRSRVGDASPRYAHFRLPRTSKKIK